MKKLTLLLISIFSFLALSAGEITEAEALQKAQKFMQGKKFKQKNLRRAMTTERNAYYIFNAENDGGFVIVSGDDRTVEILGYSDKGTLDINHMPVNLKAWLQGYQEQIETLGNSQLQKRTHLQRPAIEKLIKTAWNQRWPYNTMCPMDGENQSVTGCVATAMAQIMYYHRWPQTYDWDNMLLDYTGVSTKVEQDAVAKLMSDCGQAVDMQYSATASSANLNVDCIKEKFGYSQTARLVTFDDYKNSTWEEMIYEELAAGRPVYYVGYKAVSRILDVSYVGHAFICDGFDGEGLFHFNWGWGGLSDGYFVLSLANPSQSGIGGSEAEGGYSFYQSAIIGIQPINGATNTVYLGASDYHSSLTDCSRESLSDSFAGITISSSFHCYNTDFEGLLGFGLFKDNALLKVLDGSTTATINIDQAKEYSQQVAFGEGLEDGKYYICAIYKATGDETWSVCKEYNYLSATINGMNLSINELDKYTQRLKVNSVSLEGKLKEGNTLSAIISITNQGETSLQDIEISLGSVQQKVHANIESGETSNLQVNIPLKDQGDQYLTITCNEEQLWKERVEIEACAAYDFSGSVTIEGMVMSRLQHMGFIKGNTVKGTVTLTNNSSIAYDDDIFVQLSSKFPLREQSIHVKLEAGETKTFDFEIENLANEHYSFEILYCSANGNPYLGGYLKLLTQGDVYLPTLLVGFDYYDLRGSYTVKGLNNVRRSDDGVSLNGDIPYTTIEGTLAITNHSDKVYDDDVVLSFGLSDEYPDYSRNDTYHITLEPGETKELNYKYEGLEWEEYEHYHLIAKYNSISGFLTDVSGTNALAQATIQMFREFELESRLIMKSHLVNEKKLYFRDNKLKFSIEVTNPYDYEYDKKIYVSVIPVNKSGYISADKAVNIPPKGTITLDYEFDVDDNHYHISAAYKQDALNNGHIYSGEWKFVDDSYVALGDINGDGIVDNADIEPLLDKISEEASDYITNEAANLYNNDFGYTVNDLVVLISKINGNTLIGEEYSSVSSFEKVLWAKSAKATSRTDVIVPIEISTEYAKYTAIQMRLKLPDCRIRTDENGIPMVRMADGITTDHQVYCKWVEDKKYYAIIIYSPTNSPIAESGNLVQMTIEVDPDLIHVYGSFESAPYASEVGDNKVIRHIFNRSSSFSVEVERTPSGDANADGEVNVTDIVATVNKIMGHEDASFNIEAADVNKDGEINVTDIVMMVNIIMNH